MILVQLLMFSWEETKAFLTGFFGDFLFLHASFSWQITASLSNAVPSLTPLTFFYSVSDSLELYQVLEAGVSLRNELLIYLEHILSCFADRFNLFVIHFRIVLYCRLGLELGQILLS